MEENKDQISQCDIKKVWLHGFMFGFVVAMSLAALTLVFT